jgi:hypothetical protein
VCDDLALPEPSLRWAERAVERAALIGADRQQVFALLNLSSLLIDALRLDEAEAVLVRLAESIDRLDNDEARYARCAREAELAVARGQFDRALDAIDRGLSVAAVPPRHRCGFRVLRAQALLGAGRAEDAYVEARGARSTLADLCADSDAEEALAYAARALRELGRTGPERDELRSIRTAQTFAAALEKTIDAVDESERRRWHDEATRLARNARWKSELSARVGVR